MDSLAMAHHHLGAYPEAIAYFELALELVRGFGDRYNEAGILDHLGDSYRSAGDVPAARTVWRHALHIAEELGHPAAPDLRRKIEALQSVPAGGR